MTVRSAWLAAASAAVLVSACATPAAPPPPAAMAEAPPPAAPQRPKAQVGEFGFDVSGMDTGVVAGDDFFRHAVGKWVDRTEIPADRSNLTSFAIIAEKAAARTRTIIEDPANAEAPAGSEARKIGDYFSSFMDEARIEQLGAAPLKPELDAIGAIRTRQDLSRILGATIRADTDALNATNFYTERPFGLWVAEDLDDTTKYRAYLMQGGLGLPDREYYLADSARFVEVRGKYQAHVAAMLKLAGYPDPEAAAGRVVALETAIARTHVSVDESSDVSKSNTVWTRAELAKKAPGLDWDAFLAGAGLADQSRFGAWQAPAIAGMSKLTASQPLQAWRDYLAFHAVERGAPFLSKAFVDEHFAFNGQVLNGTPQQRDRWKRGVDFTSAALGEAIGKQYVQRHFPPEYKAQAEEMAKNVLTAFGQRIDKLEWMTPETKAEARKKLANFRVYVGYPDAWRDYSGLEIAPGDAYGNWRRASLFEYRRNVAKLGKPVDRKEWFMTPQTVNALFAPSQNSIIFPAAILEPTFFDPNADAAVNYGAIGGVIGHEVSHGFDDLGAQFDADGNLRNWWRPEDLARFKAETKKLADQYSAYEPLPGLHFNGQQVLGENIADVAGLAAAYDAYHLSLKGAPAPVLGGLSADQRFFLGWAQNYRSKFREAALRRQIVTGVHSPGPWRAVTVRNLDAWYPAFEVKEGQKLYLAPSDRVKIW
ncbi:M13 family metallopeptidase [Phenylobacterium kunshanense]|uniref:M13 family peptidase n=1 Tax=Phenylobacterium kunshanense TaxID=1445034 RepID=A0A328B8P4_9CAUL|nr:M13 family metallopeptidase [Phenylobacterium kunshanense]RAK62306.1 M13 family peptidase [Phenylobacterium kunshanense]